MFGGVSARKKKEILDHEGGIHCISRVIQGHFYCMRGPSLVELAGYYDSSADIKVHIWKYCL